MAKTTLIYHRLWVRLILSGVGAVVITLSLTGCEPTVYLNGGKLGSEPSASSTSVANEGEVTEDLDQSETSGDTESETPPAGTVSQFGATVSGLSVVAGGSITVAFQAEDLNQSVISDYMGTLTLTSTDSAAVLPSPRSVTVSDAGMVSFTGIEFRTSGTQTLTISDGTISKTITGIVVTPASLAALSFSQQPAGSSIAAGAAFTTLPRITATDTFGNPIAAQSVTLAAFTNNGCTIAATGALINGSATTIGSGLASFTGTNYRKAGDVIYLKASAGSVESSCSTGTVSIVPSAVSSIEFTQQPAGASVVAGTSFATAPKVLLKDAYNNVIPNTAVTLAAFTNSDCSAAGLGTLNDGSATSDPTGVATFSVLDYTKAETIYLKATSGSVHSNCSTGTVGVVAASASVIAFSTQPGGTNVAAGSNFTTQPVVTVTDTYGNPVASSSVSLSAHSNGSCNTLGSGTLSGGTISTNASGISTFTAAQYTCTGTLYIKAETGAVSVCSTGTVGVVAGAVASIAETTPPSVTALRGVAYSQQPSFTLEDAQGNRVGGASVTLTPHTVSGCASGAGTGVLSNPTASSDSSGVVTFSGLSYNVAETIYLKATSGSATRCTSVATQIQDMRFSEFSGLATYTCAAVNGAAKCWGDNTNGRLGDNTSVDRYTPTQVSGLASGVTQLTAGPTHTCALVGGAAKCWGTNTYGQLGTGATTIHYTPVQVTAGFGSNVAQVVTANGFTCALSSGSVSCWGYNNSGGLGNGTTTTNYTPAQVIGLGANVSQIAAGHNHACAIVDGALNCWGSNSNGRLGDNTTTRRLTPVQASGLVANVTQVSCGNNHTCSVVNGENDTPRGKPRGLMVLSSGYSLRFALGNNSAWTGPSFVFSSCDSM